MKGTIWEIIFSIVFIGGAVMFVNLFALKNFDTHEMLLRFALLMFTSIVALFIADKTITIGTQLLSTSQSDSIFEMIKYMMISIFAFYFGTNSKK